MRYISLLLFIFLSFSCSSQDRRAGDYRLVGGPCEGCEAVLEYGDERNLKPTDTLPDFKQGTTKIKITGKVYEPDGSTPARDVILYVYHTNENGIYEAREGAKGWALRHGYIRGWVKTGNDGNYTFYTFRPGTYPSRSEPAHIHLTVLEPDGRYYWLASYHFDDDPLLENEPEGNNLRGGGSRVVSLQKENGILTTQRDIILGKNVPGY